MSTEFKANQYVICKYRGEQNGDLIVGRVMDVSHTHVLLTNLLTGKVSRKQKHVIARRNVVVDRNTAIAVVNEYQCYPSPILGRKAARQYAVKLAETIGARVRKVEIRTHKEKVEVVWTEKAAQCAGQLALAAHAVLKAEDSSLGQLRRALSKYDQAVLAL